MALSVDVVVAAHDRMGKPLNRMEQRMGRFGGALKRLAAGVAVYFSARAIIGGVRESLDAFGRQELAVAKLHQALVTLGGGAEEQLPALQAYASEIQKATTVGDEAVLELMQLGASLGRLAGEDLKDATKAAIGFSKAYGIELKAAMTLVAKAAQGNVSALTRYGIMLDKTMTQEEKFQEIMRLGADAFKVAEAEADTYQGRLEQLRNAVGDLAEAIGEQLAPAMKSFAESMTETVELTPAWVRGFTNGIRDIERRAVIGAVVVQEGVKWLVSEWKTELEYGFRFVQLGLMGMAENFKFTLTDIIPQYLDWFKQNWKAVFEAIWNGVKSVVTNIATNMRDLVKAIADFVRGRGFDFEWTGLLEGFEHSMKELPRIAKRQLTEQEKMLKAECERLGGLLGESFQSEFLPKIAAAIRVVHEKWPDIPTPGIPGLAGGRGAGGEEEAKAQAAGRRRQLKVIESMFLTRAPGQDPLRQQVELLKEVRDRLKGIDEGQDDQTDKLLQGGPQLTVAPAPA